MIAADVLLTGGRVLRDAGRSVVAAHVAIAAGRVLAIGDDLRELRGATTEVVDVGGDLIHAGFTDAHVHPIQGGLERLGCDLSAESSLEGYLAVIRRFVEARPGDGTAGDGNAGGGWITGGGWQLSAFPGGTPTAAMLDAVVPDRPVLLHNRDHHGSWVNSRALELAGIHSSTPDPADGRIERDAQGRPTGTLHEGASALVQRLVPPVTADEEYAGLLEAQRHLHSFGIVGWQDAIVGSYFGDGDSAETYARAVAEGALTADVVGALWWERDRGIEQLADLEAVRARFAHGAFRTTAVKIMADGIVENYTAALGAPYLPPGRGDGISFVPRDALRDAVVALDAAGFSVHVHTIGDRAVTDALDAVAAARAANGVTPGRHHLAHIQVVDPRDIQRFAELGVTANMQALWATLEPQMRELNIPVLGAERAGWQYPFGSLARAGSPLAAGSDWPVSTPDPWRAIHVAVNRRLPADDPDFDPEPLLPHEALDVHTAFDAYTRGSAVLNGRADAGLLEPGMVADLAVSAGDPFDGPADEIGATRVTSTWVAGRRVYRAE